MENLVKISKLYKAIGVTRQTIYNWSKAGKIELIKTPGGHNFVTVKTYKFFIDVYKNNLNEDGRTYRKINLED